MHADDEELNNSGSISVVYVGITLSTDSSKNASPLVEGNRYVNGTQDSQVSGDNMYCEQNKFCVRSSCNKILPGNGRYRIESEYHRAESHDKYTDTLKRETSRTM
jgi:hypothetical protein